VSLRDQLLKAGLASKKDVRRVNQELKAERKQDQGHRDKKREVVAAEEAAKKAAEEQALREKVAARKAHEANQEAHDKVHRVRQIVLGNRLGAKGGHPFFHKCLDGRRVNRFYVSDRTAFALRCGDLAIAGLVEPDGTETYHLLRRDAAHKLAAIAPEAVVFLVDDTTGISKPEEQFLERPWDASLKPHRATGR